MRPPHELVDTALGLSKADGCVVIVDELTTANLRWANNTLTTNGTTRHRQVTVVSVHHGRTGSAAGVLSRPVVDDGALEELVRQSEAAAAEGEPAEDAQPLVEGGAPSRGWEEPPAETSIGAFRSLTPALGEAMRAARASGRLLFGFAEHEQRSTYLGSSGGLRLRHDQPAGHVEINAKSSDFARSSWAGKATDDFSDVDVAALDRELVERLGWAERRVELPPGRYQTILPPGAVADLMIYLYWSSGAREAHDGRSVWSRPGGGTRVGERLTGRPITLRSDPSAPGLACAPFVVARASSSEQSVFDNGLPLGPTDWVSGGRLAALVHTRHTAQLTGLPATPYVDNLLVEEAGASQALDEVLAGAERALLLTCLWYIREVDPHTLLLTGLTRDGVYLVEGGEVVGAVNNFRFNESPVDLLGRVTAAGRAERTLPREWSDYFTRVAAPALSVADFNMSSVSEAT